VDGLEKAIIGDDPVLHVIIPELEVNKFAQRPWAYNLELASKDTAELCHRSV
jgi:hypothetical protein